MASFIGKGTTTAAVTTTSGIDTLAELAGDPNPARTHAHDHDHEHVGEGETIQEPEDVRYPPSNSISLQTLTPPCFPILPDRIYSPPPNVEI